VEDESAFGLVCQAYRWSVCVSYCALLFDMFAFSAFCFQLYLFSECWCFEIMYPFEFGQSCQAFLENRSSKSFRNPYGSLASHYFKHLL